jgi:F-type H+-transporting ATPase subunit gamma
MAKTRELKRRIKAVANTKRITKTMQMIATAKFAQSQQRATAGKPYTEALFDLVGQLRDAAGEVDHPLLKPGNTKAPALTLVITSDRGLCGPYNSAVLRTFAAHLKQTPGAKGGRVELVGKKGLAWLKFNKIDAAVHHTHFGDKPSFETVQTLANEYIRMYAAGEVSSVTVVYMKFVSAGKQMPTVAKLLPFDANSAKASSKTAGPAQIYEFSPGAAELLGDLLPAAVRAVLFQFFNDAIVSEHIARMVAMKSATDAAGKMGKAYSRKFNRARQAQITTELMEVISGAAALK